VQGVKIEVKTNMKKIIAILVAIAMACTFAPMVGADGTEQIEVTLSPNATANITCNQTVWAPSCGLAGTESTSVTWGKVVNAGTVAVNVSARAIDSLSLAWTLENAEGHDMFQLDITGANSVALTTEDKVFDGSMAWDDETTFGLKVDMPTSSSTNTNQITVITFTATVL
jgi:hypothetical protein